MMGNNMVVSLRRGVGLRDMDVGPRATLAQFLESIGCEVIENLPSGETVVVKVTDAELEKLKGQIADKCHIVARTKGRVDI